MQYPKVLSASVEQLRKLPGVGQKTAERFAFQILEWPEDRFENFITSLVSLREEIRPCPCCGALLDVADCSFCDPSQRDSRILCVVAEAKDIYSIESTRQYRGFYHVLGGLLSPISGTDPERIRFKELRERLQEKPFDEIILALDATLEGDATALFLHEELKPFAKNITRIAFGIPMGSSFDYVDGGTLARALQSRSLI